MVLWLIVGDIDLFFLLRIGASMMVVFTLHGGAMVAVFVWRLVDQVLDIGWLTAEQQCNHGSWCKGGDGRRSKKTTCSVFTSSFRGCGGACLTSLWCSSVGLGCYINGVDVVGNVEGRVRCVTCGNLRGFRLEVLQFGTT